MAKEFAKKFYNSKAWEACRESYISKRVMIDGGLCEVCSKNIGEELHHKIFLRPTNINNPNITLNHDNLIWVCKDCHFEEHREAIIKGFNKKKRKSILTNGCYFNEDGEPVPQKVYIVYGSPASGKTTYVKENKEIGDMVIDIDYIKYALSLEWKNNETDNLLDIVLDIRELLYKAIENKKVDCKNIWIIASLPKRKEREELAKRFRAELIYINATYEDCIERAMKDMDRVDKELQKDIINKWFERYER